MTWELQPYYTFNRTFGSMGSIVDEPIANGTEWMVRCDRCGRVGVPVETNG